MEFGGSAMIAGPFLFSFSACIKSTISIYLLVFRTITLFKPMGETMSEKLRQDLLEMDIRLANEASNLEKVIWELHQKLGGDRYETSGQQMVDFRRLGKLADAVSSIQTARDKLIAMRYTV
jgi:hypothetical protein